MSIPKITHQTWLQGWDKLPEKFSENVKLLHSMNTNYTHMQWDEKTLREECNKINPQVLATFDSFKYLMQKVDLGRYVVLYNYGGISVDTDMKSFKTLDVTPGFATHDFIVSYSAFPGNILGVVNNAFIMTKKEHPILYKLIMSIVNTKVNESDFPTKELYIDATTSPSKFNKIMYANKDDIMILDHQYFEPCFSIDPICKPSDKSIMDHKHELSWFNGWTKIFVQILIILLYVVLLMIFPIIILWNHDRILKFFKSFQKFI
jgi:mannosyltransferase OCH1-like enzyme